MPDTSAASAIPQDLAGWATVAGTFFAAIISALGMRKGNADRDLPAPTPDSAGPLGLIADDSLLRSIDSTLKLMAGDVRGLRDDLEDERDRRQADKLHRAEDEARDYKAKFEALEKGQRTMHIKQDEYGENVGRLLKIMDSPDFAEVMKRLKMQ